MEFLLRRLRRDVVRRQVLVRVCPLVRRGRRRGAEDIFLEVRLLGATAYQGEARQDAFGQARLQDENSEVRRDAAVHRMVVHRDELEISALAKEDRQRVAALSGRLQVESEPGGGTAISACVPTVSSLASS